jgi:membrane-bound ClpP family serine protease
MHSRLMVAIISTVGEVATAIILAVFVLPRLNVNIPVPVLAVMILAWVGWSVFTYRKGTEALRRKPVANLVDMTGCKGKVSKALHPDGMVKMNGELWGARASDGGRIDAGTSVVVVGQKGLRLLVQPDDPGRGGAPSIDYRDNDQCNPDKRQRDA